MDNNNNTIKLPKETTEKFNTNNIKNKLKNNNELNSNKSSSRKSLRKFYKIKNMFQFPPKKKVESHKNGFLSHENSIQEVKNNPNLKFNEYDSKEKKTLSLKQSSKMDNFIKKVEEKQINNKIIKDKNDDIEIFYYDNKGKETKNQNKKTFFEIYWPILRRKHIILFTFFARKDYNIVYIKFERFIFSIATCIALNIFFFSDDSMHKIYINYGKYNFLQHVSQIIYSTIVSQVIDIIAFYLILTEKYYYQIKMYEEKNKDKIINVIKCLKTKITIFFIFTFLMFVFYWYAVACFCGVYENTQIIFIKDSISSFAFGLLLQLIIYIIPAVYKLIKLNRNKRE